MPAGIVARGSKLLKDLKLMLLHVKAIMSNLSLTCISHFISFFGFAVGNSYSGLILPTNPIFLKFSPT